MAYDDISRCGAIICTHVTLQKKAILRAVRDKPLQAEDSGWQFMCGEAGHDGEHAKLWMLSEVVDLDPSIREVLDADIGTAFERDTKKDTWTQVRYIK